MTASQHLKRAIAEEIDGLELNRNERLQIVQKFGQVPPEFDRVIITAPVSKHRKKREYFNTPQTTMVYNLKISKPFWMDENTEKGELTWEQKNREFQIVVNQSVKQIRKEQNQLRNPQPSRQPKNFQVLREQLNRRVNSLRTSN